MSDKEKIMIISPVHTVSDIRIYKKQLFSLLKAGYDVTVIAKEDVKPCSNDFPSHVKVIKLSYENRIYRFLNIPRIVFYAYKEKADVYHMHNPDTLPIGFVLKILGKKVIYDTHENFRKKILLRHWIPNLIRRPVASIVFYGEKFASYIFDATIVTQAEQCGNYFKSCLIGNSPILKNYNDLSMKTLLPSQSIKLVYLGGVSKDRGFLSMLNLCTMMNKILPTELYIIGPPINGLSVAEINEKISLYDNVFYKGEMHQVDAFEIVKHCDYGLILLEDIADYRDTNPNKLFEYMMLSTPFVATDFANWKNILNCLNAGVFVSVQNINFELANKLVEIRMDLEKYRKMSECGFRFIRDEYNWELCDEPNFLALYRKVLD